MSIIKWVGGKSKLLQHITPKLVEWINESSLTDDIIYVEPFIGSASVILSLLEQINDRKITYLANDINKELIIVYKCIQNQHERLIESLTNLQNKYNSTNEQEEIYYKIRGEYNSFITNSDEQEMFDICYDYIYDNGLIIDDEYFDDIPNEKHFELVIASLFIFLNKTCFRGLYRVNGNNEFNVPFGNYKKPTIINVEQMNSIYELIKNVKFENKSYEQLINQTMTNNPKAKFIIYLDPPYFGTFNDYSSKTFNHDSFMNLIDELSNNENVKLLVSNSDQFVEHYSSLIKNERLLVSTINVNDRINSKSPGSTRNEVLISSIH